MDKRVYCEDCPDLEEENAVPFCKKYSTDLERHFPQAIKCYACRNGVKDERK